MTFLYKHREESELQLLNILNLGATRRRVWSALLSGRYILRKDPTSSVQKAG
jgi:hypothetical protein